MRHGSPARGASKSGRGGGAGSSDDEDDDSGSGLVPGSTLGDAETVVSRSKVSLVDLVRPCYWSRCTQLPCVFERLYHVRLCQYGSAL